MEQKQIYLAGDSSRGTNEEESKERAYQEKLKSLEYRHVNKQTYWNKKYYYTVASSYTPSEEELSKCKYKDKMMVEITMKSGSKYYGEVNEKNEREGYGRYEVVNAGTYDGYWRRGFKHGQGAFWNKNGVLQYEGDWECGEPHGHGKVYN